MLPLMLGGDDGDPAVDRRGRRHRRPRRPAEAPPERAVRRPAAARRRRPGARRQARHHLRRRADGQPRLADRRRDPRLHAPRRPRVRPDDRDGHPRPGRRVVRRPGRVPQRRPDRRRDGRPDGGDGARPHEADRGLTMSSNATLLIARRSIRARIGRLIAISIAILVGVAFVVGSFVLADSLRQTSTTCSPTPSRTSTCRSAPRSPSVKHQRRRPGTRDPVPAELVDTVAAVHGVADADGCCSAPPRSSTRTARPSPPEGRRRSARRGTAPTPTTRFACSRARPRPAPTRWPSTRPPPTARTSRSATRSTSSRRPGRHSFTLVRHRRARRQRRLRRRDARPVGPADGRRGARRRGRVRRHRHPRRRRRGRRHGAAARSRRCCPTAPRSSTGRRCIEESNDSVDKFIGPFGTGLLIFAFITAFVSAFLINNVFAITIGQRLRELALLRAVGAPGARCAG